MYTLPRPCNSELTTWTRTRILQAGIRDPSRLWSSTSDYHRHQHSNDGSPQHHARYQQPPGHDKVETTARHHHRRSPDRRLSRPAAGLHLSVNSRQCHPYFYSVHGRFFASVCTHTNDPCICFGHPPVWSPMFAAVCDTLGIPRPCHACSASSSLTQSFWNLLNLLRTFFSGR